MALLCPYLSLSETLKEILLEKLRVGKRFPEEKNSQ